MNIDGHNREGHGSMVEVLFTIRTSMDNVMVPVYEEVEGPTRINGCMKSLIPIDK